MTRPIDIHVHVHEDPNPQTLRALEEIARQLTTLLAQGAATMAKMEDIRRILTEIDTNTNEIATDLQGLRDRLANASGGLTAAEAQEIADQLAAHAARLQVMGKDPDNPAPNPSEPPPAPPVA